MKNRDYKNLLTCVYLQVQSPHKCERLYDFAAEIEMTHKVDDE